MTDWKEATIPQDFAVEGRFGDEEATRADMEALFAASGGDLDLAWSMTGMFAWPERARLEMALDRVHRKPPDGRPKYKPHRRMKCLTEGCEMDALPGRVCCKAHGGAGAIPVIRATDAGVVRSER